MKKFYLPLIAGAMALSFAACGGQKSANGRESVELTGAGATFPLPFYNMSFENYNATSGDKISYGGIGSGGGVRNLKDGIVDFAGSDAFLSDKEMAEMQPVQVLHSLCHFIICLSKTTMQLLVTRFPMVVLVVAVVSAT